MVYSLMNNGILVKSSCPHTILYPETGIPLGMALCENFTYKFQYKLCILAIIGSGDRGQLQSITLIEPFIFLLKTVQVIM